MRNEILFVHGRPSGHPLHAKYGKAITPNFCVEDPWFRWHDRTYPALVRYLAWIINSFAFVTFKKKIIITECLRVTLVISKILSFSRIKLIMLVADESPYFIYSKFYSKASLRFNQWGYNQYDAFICIGEMETSLVKLALKKPEQKQLLKTINGIAFDRAFKLSINPYSYDSDRIIFIGSGPANWRIWYKGLDIMLKAFQKYALKNSKTTFEIAGEWRKESLLPFLDNPNSQQIRFLGQLPSVESFLKGAALYLHIGRGDAWPIAIMEAMAAGVVPIVSEWTGAKECVALVSNDLIVPLDEGEVSKRIDWFFQLPSEERSRLSDRCKEIAKQYSEEKAIVRFKECFNTIKAQID